MLRSMIRTRSAHVLRIFYARSTPAPPRSPRLAPSASVLERVRLSVCPPARVPAAAAAPSLPLQPLHPHPWQATVRGRAARTYANMMKPLLQAKQLVSDLVSDHAFSHLLRRFVESSLRARRVRRHRSLSLGLSLWACLGLGLGVGVAVGM